MLVAASLTFSVIWLSDTFRVVYSIYCHPYYTVIKCDWLLFSFYRRPPAQCLIVVKLFMLVLAMFLLFVFTYHLNPLEFYYFVTLTEFSYKSKEIPRRTKLSSTCVWVWLVILLNLSVYKWRGRTNREWKIELEVIYTLVLNY